MDNGLLPGTDITMHSPVPRLLPVIGLALLSAFTSAVHAANSSSPGRPDTSDWTTHCVGRHLITLPPDTRITRSTRLQGESIAPVADSVVQLMDRIEQRSLETGARRVDLGDRSIGLLSAQPPGGTGERWLQAYLVARPTWRAFDWRQPIGAEGEAKALGSADILAHRLRSREAGEIPELPGYCIDGGFIASDVDMATETRVELIFPRYPGMALSFQSGPSPSLPASPVDARPLRKKRHNVGALRGDERLLAVGDKTDRKYLFTWASQDAGRTSGIATLWLTTLPNGPADIPANPAGRFTQFSERDVLALWDAIVGTVRLRAGTAESSSPAATATNSRTSR